MGSIGFFSARALGQMGDRLLSSLLVATAQGDGFREGGGFLSCLLAPRHGSGRDGERASRQASQGFVYGLASGLAKLGGPALCKEFFWLVFHYSAQKRIAIRNYYDACFGLIMISTEVETRKGYLERK